MIWVSRIRVKVDIFFVALLLKWEKINKTIAIVKRRAHAPLYIHKRIVLKLGVEA